MACLEHAQRESRASLAVEEIITHTFVGDKVYFLVKQKFCSYRKCVWVSAECQLWLEENNKRVLQEYEERRPEPVGPPYFDPQYLQVEDVIDIADEGEQHLIKWMGLGKDQCTWEDFSVYATANTERSWTCFEKISEDRPAGFYEREVVPPDPPTCDDTVNEDDGSSFCERLLSIGDGALECSSKLRVISIGQIRPCSFQKDGCIYPVGYRSERLWTSKKGGRCTRAWYVSEILEEGSQLVCRVSMKDHPDVFCVEGKTPTFPWEKLARATRSDTGRRVTVSGTWAYGLKHQYVKARIDEKVREHNSEPVNVDES